jgi:opacity protein-like surface antigen
MVPIRAWIAAGAGIFLSAAPAAAMELSAAAPLPEASQVLGWYGNFSAGSDLWSDLSICLDPAPYAAGDCSSSVTSFDTELIYEASVGYAFRGGFRLEGEFRERRGDLESADRDRLGLDQDDARQFEVMLNGIYDFDTQTPLTPFVGAGLGGVRVQYDDPALLGDALDFSPEESAWKLGLEGFAGLQYEFTPDLRLGLRYSHKVINNLRGDSSFDSSVDTAGLEGSNWRNKTLMLTLTYEFGEP